MDSQARILALSKNKEYKNIITLTTAQVLSGTPYFDISGNGTVGNPYIITPKTSIYHGETRYQIIANVEPSANGYIQLHASSPERCQVEILHSVGFVTYHYFVNVYDITGKIRPRITNVGIISSANWDMSGTPFIINIDINSQDVYYSSSV